MKERKLKKDEMKGLEHTDYMVWKKSSAEWNEDDQEMEFDVNIIEAGLCWRLAHDGEKVLALFESDGETSSIHTLFTGTKQDCLDEVESLGLIMPPEIIEEAE